MQWQVLPALTVTTPRVAIAGALEPAYDVGGDAFDYAINGDVAHVAIVDAMGHALEASQMSTVAIGAYRHSRRLRAGLEETHRAMDAVVSCTGLSLSMPVLARHRVIAPTIEHAAPAVPSPFG